MAVELLPAVLGTRLSEYKKRLSIAERLSSTVHLDIMDGRFVRTKSPAPQALRRLRWHANIECHLMVEDLDPWLETILRLPLKRVILHVELGRSLPPYLALFRSRGVDVSLAINPDTPIARLKKWVSFTKGITIMAVRPGQYGAPLQRSTLQRIAFVRRRYPRKIIAVDGGVNETTLPGFIRAGVARLAIGSAIMQHKHPEQHFQHLRRIVQHAR